MKSLSEGAPLTLAILMLLLSTLCPGLTLRAHVKLAIYFIDVGQGNSTLIVSPTGRTMLIDGGKDDMGRSVIVPLMGQLGISKLDYMVATHYDNDHIGGLDEVAAVFPPKVAYDSGDLTSAQADQVKLSQYLSAIGSARKTIQPGTAIDLGGALVTCVVVNGDLISGGRVDILGRHDRNDQRDNSSSIGLLVQYGDFDLFLAGDLTGGGDNSTDVESTVSQLVGDVDVLLLSHHGSRTSSNRTFLRNLKAEVGIVQAGRDNSFGHPTIEVTDRFITTTPTSGAAPQAPNGNFPPMRPPVIYQNEPSPDQSDVSRQGIVADGTILIETDGASYTVSGGRLLPVSYPTDGAESGVRTDFPPSVIVWTSPVVPASGQNSFVYAEVFDDSGTIDSAAMNYSLNGGEPIPLAFTLLSNHLLQALIPGQADGTRVEYSVSVRDNARQTTTASGGYFAGVTPIEALRVTDGNLEPLYLNFSARVSGTVTVGTKTFSTQNNDIYIQDSSSGINLFERASQTVKVSPGDQVTASGRIESYNGLLQLNITNPTLNSPFTFPYGMRVLGRGDVVPEVRTIAEIGENLEGRLVRIDRVRISGSIPTEGSANLTISDGTGTLTLRVNGTTNIPGMSTPAAAFSIVGVIGQFDGFRPFTRGYQILPRSRDDFILSAAGQASSDSVCYP